MHLRSLVLFVGLLLATESLAAQQPKIDSATIARANKPILRRGELLGVLATTGVGLALDHTVRNQIHDTTNGFSRAASHVGNVMGSGLVYPTLFAVAVAGKALGSKGVYGVSSRALKSTVVAGAAAIVLKVIVGRDRPAKSPDNNLSFHPFSFKDNSFPSGHTAIAFALATSFSREIHGKWDDAAFFSLASLTAYARMHDDRHWFSDVVFGAGVGILSARFIHRREAKLLLGKKVLGASLDF
jgi:membrane-associated phospholipid phosphatase